MNRVEPIRDLDTLEAIEEYLKKWHFKYYIMFELGIYTGLRISDILKLKVKDVKNKRSIELKEQKTGKQRLIYINPVLKKALNQYLESENLKSNDYLIHSRNSKAANRPITRQQAYRVLRAAGEEFKLNLIGTHTLRKTFGYHYYEQTKDIGTLMIVFNHAHESITLRYIGITQNSLDKMFKDFKYNR